MPKEIDTHSRDILNFRPLIEFVEPDLEPQAPNPIPEPPPIEDDAEAAEKIRLELFNLAESVDVLAAALQARIDLRAKDMKIRLDPRVDAAPIAALKRLFPEAPFQSVDTPDGPEEDGFFISYDQYKACRENIRLYADEKAKKNQIKPTDVDLKNYVAGFDSPEAKDGRLRPDLIPNAQLIDPLDIGKFQNYLIRILINYIWKKFIKPTFKPIGIPGLGSIADALPDELAKLPASFKKQIGDIAKKGVEIL